MNVLINASIRVELLIHFIWFTFVWCFIFVFLVVLSFLIISCFNFVKLTQRWPKLMILLLLSVVVTVLKTVEVFHIVRSLVPFELPYSGSEAASLTCASEGRGRFFTASASRSAVFCLQSYGTCKWHNNTSETPETWSLDVYLSRLACRVWRLLDLEHKLVNVLVNGRSRGTM